METPLTDKQQYWSDKLQLAEQSGYTLAEYPVWCWPQSAFDAQLLAEAAFMAVNSVTPVADHANER